MKRALSLVLLLGLGCGQNAEQKNPPAGDGGNADLLASQMKIARQRLKALTEASQTYFIQNGIWPPTLDVLAEARDGKPALIERSALMDPWGRPYLSSLPEVGKHNDMRPDIWCVAPDGIEIGNW
jgi:hypothetical protein